MIINGCSPEYLELGLVLSIIFIIKFIKLFVALGTLAVIIAGMIFLQQSTYSIYSCSCSNYDCFKFSEDEPNQWLGESWGFAKQIMPLLAAGVLVAGFLLGSQSNPNGIIPNEWIASLVGGNSFFSNFFASITGAFMYFATLTEIPIIQGLIASGMGKGPALALLLAGPALSLPNMLVIRSVMGTQKTIVFVSLVIVMATLSGLIYGSLF